MTRNQITPTSTGIRRRTLLQSAAGLPLLGEFAGASQAQGLASGSDDKPARPNLIFILVDQLRYDVLGCAGHPMVRTPNIDRLAAEGTRMKNCYAQCAVCGPSRASMLTGHAVASTGVIDHTFYGEGFDHLMPQRTFDEVLSDAGYTAEYYGKWHSPLHRARVYRNQLQAAGIAETEFGVGLERAIGRYLDEHVPRADAKRGEQIDNGIYQRSYRMDPIDSRWGQAPSERVDDGTPEGRFPTQPDNHGMILIPEEHSITAMEGRRAIRAIEQLASEANPFTLHLDFWLPHAPVLCTAAYHGKYPASEVELPASLADPMDNSPYLDANGRGHLPQYRDPEKIRHFISNYYGVVAELDVWIGRILDTLDAQNLTDNTMVVFCSDHGEMLGAHGLREKNVFLEESAHVPMILRFPGRISAGGVVETAVSQIDLFATILDYLGVPAPANHGRSWRRLCEGREESDHFVVTEWHFHGTRSPNFMVRRGEWKYITRNEPTGQGIDCLYHLADDPDEMHNRIGRDPRSGQFQPVVRDLRDRCHAWAEAAELPEQFVSGLRNRPLV